MRETILLLILSVLGGILYAQRADNAIALHAKFGTMETFKWKGEGKGQILKDLPSMASLGGQWFIGQKGYFFEGNFIMQDFSIDYEEINKVLPYRLYGINAMGGWSLEDLNPFYLNIKAGGFAGYYIVNNAEKKEEVYNTTFSNPVEGITYGAMGEVEAEMVIYKKLSGVFSYSQYYYPLDKWIRWQYATQVGLKWYF